MNVEESEPITGAVEAPRVALGAAIDAAEARALLAEVPPAKADSLNAEDLDALLPAIHAAGSGAERGPLIARYLAAAERLSPEELSAAKARLANSFDASAVTDTKGAIR